MDQDTLRTLCLSLRGAVEVFPFGPETPVYKTQANNKVFAILSEPGSPVLSATVKCHPEDGIALRSQYPSITPGYHMNKKHWITVQVDASLSDDLVSEIITESYNLVRPKIPRASSRTTIE
ncbi:MAG: DNA-binding protein [Glaciihabitans sp.]|nr:DNA-binding protein [Glaciihabitans sp.]